MHPKITHVAALIAVHNRLALTQRCLACLREAAGEAVRLEIVIVDDGSTDGTGKWLAGQADVTTLRGDGNLWFGGATDLGLRFLRERARCDHVLVLNNDTFLRAGSLARMIAESGAQCVVACAFWTEDKSELCTSGYVWMRWRGFVDASRERSWPAAGSAATGVLTVDAISTTVVLIPLTLLLSAVLPNPHHHPHNRYDAMLSTQLRRAGAEFRCIAAILADHDYGPPQSRPTVRMMCLGRFLHESFRDRRSIWHLGGGLALAWESAPAVGEAGWALAKRLARFFRQLAWVSLNSLRAQPRRAKAAVS